MNKSEVNIKCNICKNPKMEFLFDYNYQIAYYQCADCNYFKRVPSDIVIDYSVDYMSFDLLPKSKHLADNYYKRLNGIVAENSTCLDFGGSFGCFAKLLKENKNCTVRNIELSAIASDFAVRNGVQTFGSLAELDIKNYDYIFSFHLLEHIHPEQLSGLVRELSGMLNENGTLVIFTPNADAFKLKLFKRHYSWLAADQHISFLSKSSMKYLIADNQNFEFSALSETPSIYHYPSISLISYVRGKLLKKKFNVENETMFQEANREVSMKSGIKTILKKLYRLLLTVESFVVYPFFRIIDIFNDEKDELVVVVKRKSGN